MLAINLSQYVYHMECRLTKLMPKERSLLSNQMSAL